MVSVPWAITMPFAPCSILVGDCFGDFGPVFGRYVFAVEAEDDFGFDSCDVAEFRNDAVKVACGKR